MHTLFYCNIEENNRLNPFIDKMSEYSENCSKMVYMINKPLGGKNRFEDYMYREKFILMIPGHKILLVDYGNDDEKFNDFVEDFTYDLEYLSKKYNYQKAIGRKREWFDNCLKQVKLDDIKNIDITSDFSKYSVSGKSARIVELLSSLLLGSVNDISVVGADIPENILDKVKKKIMLYDGNQSRFVYEDLPKETISIQGMAGTGKTELLLHKLLEVYVNEPECNIAFTCHNKVLAHDMHERVVNFFNFMKVEEQIDWNKRLRVCASWGQKRYPDTGIYSYLCTRYGLTFKAYEPIYSTFDKVCKLAVEELEQKEKIEKCFDYVFIDESQDFNEYFFKLIKMVTKRKVYIAGDIFQNVFDVNIKSDVEVDYSLKKCYRTDPKTLMMAHSIGMGLYEQPVIRWLDDEEWEACGYVVSRENGKFKLSRKPVRRFEDIDSSQVESLELRVSTLPDMSKSIMECIDDIRNNNLTVSQDDIAIIFIGNDNNSYKMADQLCWSIEKKYNWRCTKGYITKTKEENTLFVSNINNVKGLEFPFIICAITGEITRSIAQRNSIYMVLTRSFLTSYLVANKDGNEDFIKIYRAALKEVNKCGYLNLIEPSNQEKQQLKAKIRLYAKDNMSLEDIVQEICREYPNLDNAFKDGLTKMVCSMVKTLNDSSRENIEKITKNIINSTLGK